MFFPNAMTAWHPCQDSFSFEMDRVQIIATWIGRKGTRAVEFVVMVYIPKISEYYMFE